MKTIIISSLICLLLIIGITKVFSQPLRIHRNDNQRKLPVKRGFAGIRQVMQLRRSVLMIVGQHEILLPRRTIVDDEYQPRKIIFPEGYACTITLGGQTIKTPEGGVIRISDTHVVTVQVSEETSRLQVGDNNIRFVNAMGGEGVTFYEDGKVRCGYLAEDAPLQVDGKPVWFRRKNGINSAVWDQDAFEFGNIIFHPSGAIHKGYLRDTTALRAGSSPLPFLPGEAEWYADGSVHKGTTAQQLDGATAGAQFTIHAGDDVTLDVSGKPVIPADIVTLSAITIPAFPGVQFHQAKVRVLHDIILIQSGELNSPSWITVPVVHPDSTRENRKIPFGPGTDGSNTISFYYETFMPVYGYAGQNFSVRINQQDFVIQTGSQMRFYKSGMLEEITLGEPATVAIAGKKYQFEKGASIKWYKSGEINSDVLEYTNKRKNLVRPLE